MTPSPWRLRTLFAALLLCFVLSGAAGLLYQVVWTRMLVLIFGSTAYAVSTVLTIFFLGLGLGSAWGGRLSARVTHPLRVYALLEVIVALWAIALVLGLPPAEDLFVPLLRAVGESRMGGVLVRALLALLLLGPPVFLMGATLPLLAQFAARGAGPAGGRIGALYAANTLGAVCGCFATGFVLIPALGYTQTTFTGAALNTAAALGALVVAYGAQVPAPLRSEPAARISAALPHAATALLAAAVLGFSLLALEVLWTRLLAIVFLGTTYAYTTMLGTLLIGITLGSAAAASRFFRRFATLPGLGLSVALCGVACLASLGLIAAMPPLILQQPDAAGGWLLELLLNFAGIDDGWNAEIATKFLLAFSALVVPTALSGFAFVQAVRLIAPEGHDAGPAVGRLYAANTLGGVLGAAAGGFVLLPLLGTHHGAVALCVLLVLAGAGIALRGGGAGLLAAAGSVVSACAVFVAFVPADVNAALTQGYIPRDHRVIHHVEGTEGTVAVSEPVAVTDGRDRVLWINRVQATTSIVKGVRMNRLQGLLPLLFAHEPKRVLFMCFGSGITAGTLGLTDFERIDAVEIVPEVIAAAPLFARDNLGVAENPRLHFHIDDGRNYLLRTQTDYDLITFEPMPLAVAGVASFYTREYYAHCRDALAPGGIVSQWVPLHSLNLEVVRSLAYTFTQSFPHYCAFFINADLFFVGSEQPLQLDYAAAERRLAPPAIQAAMQDAGFHDLAELFACFLLGQEHLDRFAAGGHLLTDDRPWAEFEAPKLVYAREVPESLAALIPLAQPPAVLMDEAQTPPDAWARIMRRAQAHHQDLQALMEFYGGMAIGSTAAVGFLQSLEFDPLNENAKFYLRDILNNQAEILLRWEKYDELIRLLERAQPLLPEMIAIDLWLGDAYFGEGDPDLARAYYLSYLAGGGDAPRAAERSR